MKRFKIVLIALTLGLITSCSSATTNDSGNTTEQQKPYAPPTYSYNLEPNTLHPVRTPVEVTTTNGTIINATLTNLTNNRKLTMSINENGSAATFNRFLGYDTEYKIDTTVRDENKKNKTETRNFRTVKPNNLTLPYISPEGGDQFGSALPIIVRFDEPIPDRKAATDALTVEASSKQQGAWRWYSDTEVHYRPREFWVPGTTIKLTADIYGKDFGNGLYGQENVSVDFKIAGEYGIFVNNADKLVRIFHHGKEIKTMPTSMGREDGIYNTPSGQYYIGWEKNESMIMDSSTYGLTGAGSYRTPVTWATRISNSGIFLHQLSNPQIGISNTSHGCLNLYSADAQWILQNVPVGTPVKIINTGVDFDGSDGMGDWMIPFEQYAN